MVTEKLLIDQAKLVLRDINEYLEDLNLRAVLLKDYSWKNGYVAIYKNHSAYTGVLRIGYNPEAILNFIKSETENNNTFDDIEEQAFFQVSVSLWHEVGHGICEHIRRKRRLDTQAGTKIFVGDFLKETRALFVDEEQTVEDFGEFMTGLSSFSDLYYYIEDYQKYLLFTPKENTRKNMKLKEETLNSGLPKYRGCKDIEIIWHGDWADPELRYNGYVANYYKIDNEAAVYAKTDGVDVDCEKAFNSFVQQHEDNIGNRIIQTGKKEYNPFEDNEELNESYYGFEQKDGKYYLYSNGVRVRVSKETWENAKEEERQEKIKNMNKKDAEDRKNNEIRLNESQFRNLISESIKSVLNESSLDGYYTVEDICQLVGCSIDNQERAQEKIEQLLMALRNLGVISGFNEDKLDLVFSDEQSY